MRRADGNVRDKGNDANVTEFLLLANICLTGALLLDGLKRRGGYVEVPFLSAAVYAVWFLPQAVALLDDSTLQAGALTRVLVMSFLCLFAIWWGWRSGTSGLTRTKTTNCDSHTPTYHTDITYHNICSGNAGGHLGTAR